MTIQSIILELYGSLGETLTSISTHPDVHSSAFLMERVQTVVFFHGEMEPHLYKWIDTHEKAANQLADFLEKAIVVDTATLNKFIKKYQHFRELGATPLVIHKMALDDYITERDQPRVLCTVFDISTEEAQAIIQEYKINFAKPI